MFRGTLELTSEVIVKAKEGTVLYPQGLVQVLNVVVGGKLVIQLPGQIPGRCFVIEGVKGVGHTDSGVFVLGVHPLGDLVLLQGLPGSLLIIICVPQAVPKTGKQAGLGQRPWKYSAAC